MFGYFARWRQAQLARRVALARREGIGVYVQEWITDGAEVVAVGEDWGPVSAGAILAWCRDTMTKTRRPFGIAHFDLAVAATSGSSHRGSLSLKRLAPSDLYPGDSFIEEIERFLGEHGPISHAAVALFSWGDAAYAAQRG